MVYITLAQAKEHCNIEAEYTDDDSYINSLIEVAEAVVAKDICENLEDLTGGGELPSPLHHAMLLLVGNYYANREPVAFANSAEVPLSYKHLISLYRNYGG
ncbi:head-tail connector protein [uncultured Bacteroides sp.]|uniref:head-tail connector protein n=1 Tax=uncultured Bacteroides sp. TaxID=162156 RepID=UPI002AA9219F|nr:head-tail connector protein [uncultured Bacteroides sp.]